MTDDIAEVASLAEGLNATARRRLWLVWRVTQHCQASDINAALEGLIKLDEFIVSGRCQSVANIQNGNTSADPNAALGDPAQLARATESAALSDRSQSVAADGRNGRPQRSLLDSDARGRFVAEAARNSDNRHLAQVFGLTVRQAHAIRVALSKLITQAQREQGVNAQQPVPRPVRRGSPLAPSLDRQTELKLQEEFLRAKAPPRTSLEDIVRYLRQKGDVVFSDGDCFMLNYRLKLTPAQLIDRANAKRRESNQDSFVLEQPNHAGGQGTVDGDVHLEDSNGAMPHAH